MRIADLDPAVIHGRAWLALVGCLALHVADEATHDFLALYNPIARQIRVAIPILPVPVFSFRVWLAGLVLAVVMLGLLSRFVFAGRRWTRPASYIFAVFMFFNGLTHIIGSLYSGHLLAGVLSSPFLIVAAMVLVWSVPRHGLRQVHRV